MTEIEYYHKNAYEQENVEAFKKFVAANSKVDFFQPAPDRAPWHVQAKVNGRLLSFWPHMMKGRTEEGNERTRSGRKHLQSLIDRARVHKDFSVID
jgi:hypothetical protein